MRVLLTEDNPDLLRMLTIMLQPHMEVVVPSACTKLLEDKTWEGIDAALIDLMTPEVSGAEVLMYLKIHQPQIRRVVLTAIGLVPKEIEELADVVLRKPADHHTILLALRSVGA